MIAIYGEVNIENLLELLIDFKRVCLENTTRESLNLEDTPRPVIKYSTNYREYLRVLLLETLPLEDIISYFQVCGAVSYFLVAFPIKEHSNGMPHHFLRYRGNVDMSMIISAIPRELEPWIT